MHQGLAGENDDISFPRALDQPVNAVHVIRFKMQQIVLNGENQGLDGVEGEDGKKDHQKRYLADPVPFQGNRDQDHGDERQGKAHVWV